MGSQFFTGFDKILEGVEIGHGLWDRSRDRSRVMTEAVRSHSSRDLTVTRRPMLQLLHLLDKGKYAGMGPTIQKIRGVISASTLCINVCHTIKAQVTGKMHFYNVFNINYYS